MAAQPEQAADGQSVSSFRKRGWFARPLLSWRTLSWGALAAGVVVAGTLLLQHPAKQMQPIADKQTAPSSLAASPTLPAEPSAVVSDIAGRQTKAESRRELARNTEPASKVGQAGFRKKDALKPEAKALAMGDEKEQIMAAAPGPVLQPQSAARLDALTGGVAEVANKPAATDQSEAGTLLAKNNEDSYAVHKAKPATPEEQGTTLQAMAKAAPARASVGAITRNEVAASGITPQWSLSAGMLRRSTDGGANWQTALPDGRLLCYALRGNEVWTGGKSGLLFHSANGGATWTQVRPSAENNSLTNDVTKLEMSTASAIVLTTDNGETWSSVDAGKSWTRK